jgi:transposase
LPNNRSQSLVESIKTSLTSIGLINGSGWFVLCFGGDARDKGRLRRFSGSRGRGEVSSEEWAVLESLLRFRQRTDGRGRPPQDRRAVLNGVLWILRTGPQWRELPKKYPAYQTCHRRFQQWVRSGQLNRAFTGTGAGTPQSRAAATGGRLAGRHFRECEKRGLGRGADQDGRKLRRYKRRWCVERLYAWLQWFRRLVTRYEYQIENFLGMVRLGCMRIMLRYLSAITRIAAPPWGRSSLHGARADSTRIARCRREARPRQRM